MQTVEITAQLDASRAAVEAALSPRTVVEYEGTYEVRSVSECAEEKAEWVVVADAEADESDLVAEFRVTERPDGYEYEQINRGPFERLRTMVTLGGGSATDDTDDGEGEGGLDTGEDDPRGTIMTVHSQFTFGGWLAPVVDRLAKQSRHDELDRAVTALARDVAESTDSEDV